MRIGVHTGEVRLRDKGNYNYVGSTVNRTALLRNLAHGGQILLSSATKNLVFDGLPSGGLADLSGDLPAGVV
ncbi:adenylate/guanylate cyclase domain-containing protein [Mycobacterium uberis]|uniref:adenylate/guanylate cyclase domain-containing protein n=1 Tax=Mycobacterium uberis TaxID=2162698 RepID=UPI0014037051|nr:adenylate/guanylate cyclase domain-containing protein [Mycobacterium uberis]